MKKLLSYDIIKARRVDCRDNYHAFMLNGAIYSQNDIPICPTTATTLPEEIITWDEAKSIYKEQISKHYTNFKYNAFVCFYMDDYKFDGLHGIWHNSSHALKILQHFAGVITPDFSTYQDFPEPLKIYNTYRMRAWGYWMGSNGIPVINNVRWGTSESYRYCFDGIETHSIIAIGTVGGSPRKLIDRKRFEEGFEELLRVLKPHAIIVYGSANYACLNKATEKGLKIIAFSSKTAKVFERRKQHNE